MKLGAHTNSMTNYLMSGTKGAPEPVVGMGATLLMWTDREPYTIVKVTPMQVHAQRDTAIRTDSNGMSECQSYNFESNPTAAVEIFRKRKGGGYHKAGSNAQLRIGERDKYHDYSF